LGKPWDLWICLKMTSIETQTGLVFYKGLEAGRLTKRAEGYEFQYTQDYLQRADALPISLSLPLTETPYQSPALFPFFDGLLPEGWLLELASRGLKIDKKDKFNLLLELGAETVGAVTVKPLEKRGS